MRLCHTWKPNFLRQGALSACSRSLVKGTKAFAGKKLIGTGRLLLLIHIISHAPDEIAQRVMCRVITLNQAADNRRQKILAICDLVTDWLLSCIRYEMFANWSHVMYVFLLALSALFCDMSYQVLKIGRGGNERMLERSNYRNLLITVF
jgi:hypothetical protein